MPNYTSIIPSGGYLTPGEYVTSVNKVYKLTYTTDGNLAFEQNNNVIWDIGINISNPLQGIMQPDGNFVLYDSNNNPYWASGTAGDDNSILVVEDEGNAVICEPAWQVLPTAQKKKAAAGVLLAR